LWEDLRLEHKFQTAMKATARAPSQFLSIAYGIGAKRFRQVDPAGRRLVREVSAVLFLKGIGVACWSLRPRVFGAEGVKACFRPGSLTFFGSRFGGLLSTSVCRMP
jgi:hypothetical protein